MINALGWPTLCMDTDIYNIACVKHLSITKYKKVKLVVMICFRTCGIHSSFSTPTPCSFVCHFNSPGITEAYSCGYFLAEKLSCTFAPSCDLTLVVCGTVGVSNKMPRFGNDNAPPPSLYSVILSTIILYIKLTFSPKNTTVCFCINWSQANQVSPRIFLILPGSSCSRYTVESC